MGNDLRERLEALKEKSEQTCLSECEREFRMELATAFRSGELVTRSEMESREAILVKALRFIDETISWEINTGNYDHEDVCAMDSSWCEIGEVAEKALDSVTDHPLKQQSFTREELDEAVAKAVAEEREACARAAVIPCYETRHVTLGDKVDAAIRARSEQKEGE